MIDPLAPLRYISESDQIVARFLSYVAFNGPRGAAGWADTGAAGIVARLPTCRKRGSHLEVVP